MMYKRLFPNSQYIPIICINSDRSLNFISTHDFLRPYDTVFQSLSAALFRKFVTERKNITDFVSVRLHRIGYIMFNNHLFLDPNYKISVFAVIKTEDFKNGIDYTDPNNWYYVFNYGTALSNAKLDDIKKSLDIPKKRAIPLTTDLSRIFFNLETSMEDIIPSGITETSKQFFEYVRREYSPPTEIEELV